MPVIKVQGVVGGIIPGGSKSVSFATLPQVGNMIVVVVVDTFNATTCGDNQGNTYTLQTAAGGTGHMFVYTAPVVNSSGTFTVTGTGSACCYVFAYEFSGLGNATLDNYVEHDGVPGTSVSTNITTNNPIDLVMLSVYEDNGGSSADFDPMYVAAGGATFLDEIHHGSSGSGAVAAGVAFFVAAPASTYTLGFTMVNTGRTPSLLLTGLGPTSTSGPAFLGIAEEHYIWSRKLTMAEHQAAMKGSPSSTNLVLSCLMGNSPEIDISGNAGSGTVTGTTLVAGHP